MQNTWMAVLLCCIGNKVHDPPSDKTTFCSSDLLIGRTLRISAFGEAIISH